MATNPEDGPHARLNMSGKEVTMTPENGSLFTFVGRTALSDGTVLDSSALNHVFVSYGENERGQQTGSYIFAHNGSFDELADYMKDTGFTLHLNLRGVAQCDLEAYEKSLALEAQDLDHVPENWA